MIDDSHDYQDRRSAYQLGYDTCQIVQQRHGGQIRFGSAEEMVDFMVGTQWYTNDLYIVLKQHCSEEVVHRVAVDWGLTPERLVPEAAGWLEDYQRGVGDAYEPSV